MESRLKISWQSWPLLLLFYHQKVKTAIANPGLWVNLENNPDSEMLCFEQSTGELVNRSKQRIFDCLLTPMLPMFDRAIDKYLEKIEQPKPCLKLNKANKKKRSG